jgi:hypothetical protein
VVVVVVVVVVAVIVSSNKVVVAVERGKKWRWRKGLVTKGKKEVKLALTLSLAPWWLICFLCGYARSNNSYGTVTVMVVRYWYDTGNRIRIGTAVKRRTGTTKGRDMLSCDGGTEHYSFFLLLLPEM